MSFYWVWFFSYSISIAALLGIVRRQRILPADRPFLYYVWVAVTNEIISLVVIKVFHANSVNGNCYVLAEALLLTWWFRNQGAFRRNPRLYLPVMAGLGVVWIADNLLWHRLDQENSLFRILYSFVLIFLAIDRINRFIIQERENLLRNGRFLVCIGVILYYPYRAAIEVFFFLQLRGSNSFYSHIFMILVWVNLIVNLLYALAIVWMPTRQKFILR